jgi:hypothetical protein
MKPEDRDQARGLAALNFLRHLLAAAEQQLDVVTWRRQGGPEAEDFLHAVESGGQHWVLRRWETLKATVAGNRPVAGLLDRNTRRMAILLAESLVRAGLGKDAARKRTAEAVKSLLPETTKRTIKYWQGNYLIQVEDEGLIAQAIERQGHDPDRLVGHFVGLIQWVDNPLAAWTTVRRRLPPAGQ